MLQPLSPKRRFRWSTAHSSPYATGRPPGALSGNRRRVYPHDWELRHSARIDELSSDASGSGIYTSRDASGRRRRSTSSSQNLLTTTPGSHRTTQPQRILYDDSQVYDDYFSDDDAFLEPATAAREQALVESALERIAKARTKGQTNVNLTQDEMEALERRANHPPATVPQQLASPPPTPGKKSKSSSSRPSSSAGKPSSASLAGQKTTRRSSSGLFGNSSSSSSSKSSPKSKLRSKPSAEKSSPSNMALAPYGDGQFPPGSVFVPGPDGRLYAAPLAYFQPTQATLESSRSTRSRSASKSSSRRRQSTPPEAIMQGLPLLTYAQHQASASPNSSSPWYYRPGSSSSLRSYGPPEDPYRAGAAAPYLEYDPTLPPPALPAASSRSARRASVSTSPSGNAAAAGHSDPRYPSLRRYPPSSGSPLAQRAVLSAADGLRSFFWSQGGGAAAADAEDLEDDDDDDDEDDGNQGVLVDVVPDGRGGYDLRRRSEGGAAAPAAEEGVKVSGGGGGERGGGGGSGNGNGSGKQSSRSASTSAGGKRKKGSSSRR